MSYVVQTVPGSGSPSSAPRRRGPNNNDDDHNNNHHHINHIMLIMIIVNKSNKARVPSAVTVARSWLSSSILFVMSLRLMYVIVYVCVVVLTKL